MAFNLAPFSDLSNALFKNFRFFFAKPETFEKNIRANRERRSRKALEQASTKSFNHHTDFRLLLLRAV